MMTEPKPEMLQLAFMKNSDSVALISENRHLVCNESYVKLFAYDSLEEICFLPFTDLFPEEELAMVEHYLERIRYGEREKRFLKTKGLKKDGSLFSLELSTSSCITDENETSLFLIAARDNSVELRMEEELEKNRQSLALIKHCHKILLTVDNEQTFMDRICSLISRTESNDLTWYTLKKEDGNLCTGSFAGGEKVIGSIRSLYISSKSMKDMRTIQFNNLEKFTGNPEEQGQLLAGGFKSVICFPLIIDKRAHGTLNIYSRTFDHFRGDMEFMDNLVEDICYGIRTIRLKDKQSELEKQLLQAQKMETIGTLAGGIAHDFNNIMTPILGYSEIIMAKMTVDDPLYQYNQQILNGAVRAKELVKQILAFSHKENHTKEPVFIDKIIKETLQLMSSLIPRTISIYKHLDHHCGKVLADPAQLHQVIANLCTNSFHAMEETGGHLTVELKKVTIDLEKKQRYPELNVGEHAQLIIADSGKGMNHETKHRIFEPFFTTKPVGKGTGLGLSVVHGIIKNHSGTITVESEENMGTVFRIFLPLIKQDDNSPEERLLNDEETKDKRSEKIILLLDDHRDITELLKIMLMNQGFSVESYNDSQTALKDLLKDPGHFSLVITDLYMPEIKGIDLLKEIHRKRKDLPSIIITGHDDELSEWEKKTYNIKKILHKPILRNSFIEAVTGSLAQE